MVSTLHRARNAAEQLGNSAHVLYNYILMRKKKSFLSFCPDFFEEFLFSMIYVTVKFSSVSDHENENYASISII